MRVQIAIHTAGSVRLVELTRPADVDALLAHLNRRRSATLNTFAANDDATTPVQALQREAAKL